MWFILQVFCSSTFSATPLIPEQVEPLSEPWRWRHITRLDEAGFRCFEEGLGGELWFGVNRGVLRYDGLRWNSFGENEGFTDESINSICRGADGEIYAATRKRVWCYRDGSWRVLPFGAGITGLRRSRSGVWVCTYKGAIHVRGSEIKLYTTGQVFDKASKFFRAPFEKRLIPDALVDESSFQITEVCEEENGFVWFAVNRNSLIRFDSNKAMNDASAYMQFRHGDNDLLLQNPIRINTSGSGEVWVSSAAGIFAYDSSSNRWNPCRVPGIKSRTGHEFAFSYRNNALFFALLNHVYIKKGETWSIVEIPSLQRSMPHVLEASDGSLWVGKEQGKVFRIDQSNEQWATYKNLHFQCEDHDGGAWFMTSDNRAVVKRDQAWLSYSVDDGLMDTLLGLYCSTRGRIWAVGSHRHRAATAYLDKDRWVLKRHEGFSECMEGTVGLAAENGKMIFASRRPRKKNLTGGLLHVSPAGERNYTYEMEKIPSSQLRLITGIAQVGHDRYYALPSLVKRDGKSLKKVELPLQTLVFAMTTDLDHRLWVALINHGVSCYNGTNWTNYTTEDGLGGSRISAIEHAPDGTLWAAMADGISRFDGEYWQSHVLGEKLRGFAISEGSLKVERTNSIWINYAKKDWYIREFMKVPYEESPLYPFKTTQYKPAKNEPETELITHSEKVSPPGNIYFEWSGVSQWESTPKQDLTFSCRVNGGPWSPFSKKTNHHFLSLDPGRYALEVRARDRDFNIDATPAMCSFVVLAPIWQKPWFVILGVYFVGSLVLLAYVLIRSRSQAQRHAIEVEQIKLRFFTSISHEFRTPLTVLLAPLTTLLEREHDPKQKDLLRMMMLNGKKLRRLVDQILDIRKLDSGRMPIEWAKGDIVAFTKDIAEGFAFLAEQAHITMSVDAPNAVHMVWFDSDKWHKIISNLISNAIKFTPENGFVKILIRVDRLNQPSTDRIVVTVEDSGVGIPEKEQIHVFERFYRAKSATKGSGIGLSFVKELVDLLHGKISFVSPIAEFNDKPCGTQFVVELPISEQVPEDVEVTDTEALTTDSDLLSENVIESNGDEKSPPSKVLVVDDSIDIQRLLQSELSDLYKIRTAENGSVGLNIAKEWMPDLIITDVMMPVMDGIELCENLKTDEITSHIPIIMLTARSSQGHELQGLNTGADDYIKKPFSTPLLKARIRSQLESCRRLRERFSQSILFDTPDLPAIEVSAVDQAFIERALRIIHERMGEYDFDAAAFANAMGMGERTLRNKLKAVMNLTPVALIRKQRLGRAKEMLEQGGDAVRVSEVGASVGFLDLSHFGRLFKKEYGKTPSEISSTKK